MRKALATSTLAATALLAATPSHALGPNDAAGDYVAGYAGSRIGDLDVIGAFVTYNIATDKFVFSATMENNIGLTPGGFYIWGVNRGNGAAAFAANGFGGVLFDSVLRLNQDGSGTANGSALAAGTAKVIGSTIVVEVAASLFPSTGFAKTAYTWNLWPRDATQSGFGQISDFAPDNSNAPVIVIGAVPEPGTWALMGAGLLGLARLRHMRARSGR